MGALRKSAGSAGDELGEYYVAALEFIDPALTVASPLEDILTAVSRRRLRLHERPLYQIEDELSALNEALNFVQRVKSGGFDTATPDPQYLNVDVDEAAPAGDKSLAELWTQALAGSATPPRHDAVRPEPAGEKPVTAGQDLQPEDQPAAQATLFDVAVKPRQPVAARLAKPLPAARTVPTLPDVKPDMPPRTPQTNAKTAAAHTVCPRPTYRRRSLRETMESARVEPADETGTTAATGAQSPAAVSSALPETQAWPLATGLALIAWQAGLALFCGWTATRFFAWPRPGLGYELAWPAITGLVLLGLVTAAVVGRGTWLSRQRSRRIACLVHGSAAAVAVNLLAWWLATQRLGTLIDGPLPGCWAFLAGAWLLTLPVIRLNDLLVERATERQAVRQAGPGEK